MCCIAMATLYTFLPPREIVRAGHHLVCMTLADAAASASVISVTERNGQVTYEQSIGLRYPAGYSFQMHTILPENKNPALRQIAQELPVDEIKNKKTQNLIKEMRTLLAKEKYGVALAAPQVGEPIRLFIVSGRALARGSRNAPDSQGEAGDTTSSKDNPKEPPPPDQVYINPRLMKMSRRKSPKHEGCLSIRGKWGVVPRAEKATVRAYDENGAQFTRGASGFLAHIFQHELDHLEGILYTDKATEMYDEEPDEKK